MTNRSTQLRSSGSVTPHPEAWRARARGRFSVSSSATETWSLADSGVAPQWVELLPLGDFEGRDGRGPFRVSDPEAVIAATRALRMGAGIPIDYDHAIDFAAPAGVPAPAAGWISELAMRGGSIWGRVEWTEHGAQAIRMREYRYLSPVFQFSADGEVVRILRAGLTNNPNLYLTAICAAEHEDIDMDELLAQLREILGMDDDADSDQILERVRQFANSGAAADGDESESTQDGGSDDPDPAQFVAMAQFQRALTELNQLRVQRGRERAERAVDEALRFGKLIPAQREWAISYCQADFKGFNDFIARQPAMLQVGEQLGSELAPRRAKTELLTASEIAICTQLGVPPDTFLKRKTAKQDFLRLNKNFE
ncbi:MAG TPA: phage protease [Candidatus Binataceae bacterium]|nr:phage protease [Candidatus Binataceae bacterium]